MKKQIQNLIEYGVGSNIWTGDKPKSLELINRLMKKKNFFWCNILLWLHKHVCILYQSIYLSIYLSEEEEQEEEQEEQEEEEKCFWF